MAKFAIFVEETSYITEAELYGWSYVQTDVFRVDTVHGANWRRPDGLHPASSFLPVTQVSYNDAVAYCKWARCRLPTYDEYWSIAPTDTRTINIESHRISSVDEVSIVGNCWEICVLDETGFVPLAGGSFLCSKRTCDGTSENRRLRVDPTTANLHIGFAVIR